VRRLDKADGCILHPDRPILRLAFRRVVILVSCGALLIGTAPAPLQAHRPALLLRPVDAPMANDKSETIAAQVEAPKAVTKKPKKASDGKKKSAMERFVADTKALYSDLDMSEGRKMRKRPASTTAAAPKKAKKAPAAKKAAAAKKAPAKKAAVNKVAEDGGKAE